MENQTNAVDTTTETNAVDTTTETKTFTQEEVASMLQAEADKRVSEALKTQAKKYEKQLSLSKLDDDARAKAEKENEINELKEKLAQYEVEKNRSELKSVLATRGLSAEFADIINITNDIEASQSNIDKLDKLFKDAVKTEIEKRLMGTAPKGNGAASTPMNKEAFTKLPIAEQQKLLNSNPEFYNSFLQ